MLGQVLSSIDHNQYLFPEDEIVPYMAIKSNATLIVSKRTTVVMSDLNCPQRTLLSSNCWQAPMGMMCNLNVYGCLYENIKEHLILHFAKFLCRSMSDCIVLRGISSKGTNWTFLDSAVAKFGFKRTESYGTGDVGARRRIQHCTTQNVIKKIIEYSFLCSFSSSRIKPSYMATFLRFQ
ncbi:unnamed protein product [Mytilus edulis]|uniref:Histidine N-acetyltransferase C-terminal domain-containing protein n=1 Tax=Mytilus edulis TaxID=6550 RepID=A0A8S3U1I4_MYTED|nr:unnamed protein product [Mytilus edulis]